MSSEIHQISYMFSDTKADAMCKLKLTIEDKRDDIARNKLTKADWEVKIEN